MFVHYILRSCKVEVTINGESHVFEKSLAISDLIIEFQLDPTRVAIEKNLVIIADNDYDSTHIENGDNIEIVQFIGGG